MNTSIKVFNLFNNVKFIIEKNKNIEFLNTFYRISLYQKQNSFVKNKCEDIAVLINNNHFELKDYIIYLFDYYFFNDTLEWPKISKNEILECKKRYTQKELKKSQKLILEIKENSRLFEKLEDLYRIDDVDGSNILYELIKGHKITPFFYVKYFNKVSENIFEDSNKNIKNINKICLYLYKLFNSQIDCKYLKEIKW